MPELKTYLTRASAVELVQAILAATGEKNYRAARDQARATIVKAWPEIMGGESVITDEHETRSVAFTDKQLRAMGEGFLSLLAQPNSNGADMVIVRKMATTLQLTKWLDHFLGVDDSPGLDFPLDSEPEIGD